MKWLLCVAMVAAFPTSTYARLRTRHLLPVGIGHFVCCQIHSLYYHILPARFTPLENTSQVTRSCLGTEKDHVSSGSGDFCVLPVPWVASPGGTQSGASATTCSLPLSRRRRRALETPLPLRKVLLDATDAINYDDFSKAPLRLNILPEVRKLAQAPPPAPSGAGEGGAARELPLPVP